MKTNKSNQVARGTVQCQNTNINLLKANDFVADIIRKQMSDTNTLLINITSSAGSGKTTLLQQTAQKIKSKLNIAVMVGDLETERDAIRIRQTGIHALQIVTGGICHLEAQMVYQALDQFNLKEIDILFIENVGNLVCPASFDLGEDYRVTLLATTEGDDKPKKYPKMFLTSDMLLVSKSDLLPYLPFSVDTVIEEAKDINHAIEAIQISSIKGEGLDQWCNWLISKVEEKQKSVVQVTA